MGVRKTSKDIFERKMIELSMDVPSRIHKNLKVIHDNFLS